MSQVFARHPRPRPWSLLPLGLMTLVSCSAPTGHAQGVPRRQVPALRYEASFRGLEPVQTNEAFTVAVTEEKVRVEFLFLELDARQARVLEGDDAGGPSAWTATRAQLGDWLALGQKSDARVRAHQSLAMASAQRATVVVSDERAYVADYTITGTAESVIADPVVKTLRTGLVACVRTLPGSDGRVDLDLALDHAHAAHPFPEETLRVPPLALPVTLQTPRALTQHLETRVELSADECLVLAWPDPQVLHRRCYALVRAEPSSRVAALR